MPEILSIADTIEDRDQVEGVALLHGISFAKTKNGSDYATGMVSTKSGTYTFKKWDTADLESGIYHIKGSWNVYNDKGGLIVKALTPVDGFSKTDFMQTKYDWRSLFTQIKNLVKSNTTDKGYELFKLLLQGNKNANVDSWANRFVMEFGAVYHHDNMVSGLIAHSLKTGKVLALTLSDPIQDYANMPDWWKDVVIVGGTLHDIGKVAEYSDGEISEVGKYVSHRTLAAERVMRLKEPIIELVGEDGYWTLISIYSQHHGEYEEKPRTIAAMVVHFADAFETNVTSLSEAVREQSHGQTRFQGYILKTPEE